MQDRLRDLGAQDGDRAGQGSGESGASQTERLLSVADEFGILNESDLTWSEFFDSIPDEQKGSEHVVEFDFRAKVVGKTTIPPGFGLTPFLNRVETISADPTAPKAYRASIEFRPATLDEYLARWAACNEIFGDNVRIASVIRWKDGQVSLCIIQPQYPGERADDREIRTYLVESGWTHLPDPSGHNILFHHTYQVLAIDAVGRNCFLDPVHGIQPFDVILCAPDGEMEKFLGIYPQ